MYCFMFAFFGMIVELVFSQEYLSCVMLRAVLVMPIVGVLKL